MMVEIKFGENHDVLNQITGSDLVNTTRLFTIPKI